MHLKHPKAGRKLRRIRADLHLSMRDVVQASKDVAKERGKRVFTISLCSLSDMETKGRLPNIYRLTSLAHVYRKPVASLLRIYDAL